MDTKDTKLKWLDWSIRLQSVAQAGLAYSEDKYDIERFRQVRDVAAEIVSTYAGMSFEKVNGLFCNEEGYQTPKIDVRAAVFRERKILLVREKKDGRWALPGGWAEADLTLRENVTKEVLEEAGLRVTPERLIAVLDRRKRSTLPSPYGVYKVFVLCSLQCGTFRENIETSESGFFGVDELPEMSEGRTTEEQVIMCFDAGRKENAAVIFD